MSDPVTVAPGLIDTIGERWYINGHHFDSQGKPLIVRDVVVFTGDQPEPIVYVHHKIDAMPFARRFVDCVRFAMGHGPKPAPDGRRWTARLKPREGLGERACFTDGVECVDITTYNVKCGRAVQVILNEDTALLGAADRAAKL